MKTLGDLGKRQDKLKEEMDDVKKNVTELTKELKCLKASNEETDKKLSSLIDGKLHEIVKNSTQQEIVFGNKIKNDMKSLEQDTQKIKDFNAYMKVRLKTTVKAKLDEDARK